VLSRGNEQRDFFLMIFDDTDRHRFLDALSYPLFLSASLFERLGILVRLRQIRRLIVAFLFFVALPEADLTTETRKLESTK